MHFRATLNGSGSAAVVAYGPADAEATLEKELKRVLPAATIQMRGMRRTDDDPRIVEEFLIDYVLRLEVVAEGEDEAAAKKKAFADVRAALKGSRFEKIAWDRAVHLSAISYRLSEGAGEG